MFIRIRTYPLRMIFLYENKFVPLMMEKRESKMRLKINSANKFDSG